MGFLRHLLLAPSLPVTILIGAAIGWRAWYAVQFSQLLDCNYCLVTPTVINEVQPFLALLCMAWALGRWLPRMAVTVRLATVAALLVSWGDIAVQRTFATRLSWNEVRKFWSEAGTLVDFAKIMTSSAINSLLAVLTIGAIVWVLCRYLTKANAVVPHRIFALGACALTASLLASEASTHSYYVNSSLLTLVQKPTRHTPYPADWSAQHLAGSMSMQEQQTCHPPQAPLGIDQVIIVIVESLSSYQSQGFGGIHDWTPQLDRWARSGWKFDHFLANGKNTEDGLYALLTGRNPIPAPGLDSIYAQPLDPLNTLPKVLGRHGFHTAFLTSGDLGFMNKGEWLRRVGFDEIEGHQAPFYDGHQRYHFSAAKDDVLYARALQWITQRTREPYLLTLETVSSHQPFFDPENKRISAEGAFRYTDAALGRFIEQLHATGFLQKGLLVITSDHRAMVPATAGEKAQMGPHYLSRIPFLMLGKGIPTRQVSEARAYSQQDLLPSLASLLTGQGQCTDPWQGIFTPTYQSPAQCIASHRATQPDSVFLQCEQQDLEVRLDGATTRYLNSRQSDPAYLRLIHAQRSYNRPP